MDSDGNQIIIIMRVKQSCCSEGSLGQTAEELLNLSCGSLVVEHADDDGGYESPIYI